MTEKLPLSEIEDILNRVTYPQSFRLAMQEEGHVKPITFIRERLLGIASSQTASTASVTPTPTAFRNAPVTELTQQQLIDEIDEKGRKIYDRLDPSVSYDARTQEWIETCKSQWSDREMTPAARAYAERTLIKIRKLAVEQKGATPIRSSN